MNQHSITGAGSPADYTRLTATIVSAYVKHNNVPTSDLAALIASAADALIGLTAPETPSIATAGRVSQAQIRNSITHEALISFEDGKGYKTLKRHLTTCGLTPETYRAKWGLPRDYPMVAPGYSERRSAIATSLQLRHAHRSAARTAGRT
ncbi:MucR family transcriptional regulator [Methylobacterium mesophilicum]|uniref:MucR family transcriptional regulator n=1 Tax=Methylobacterium mesophilicum TaxID=39956 RepID=UPI002F2EBA77